MQIFVDMCSIINEYTSYLTEIFSSKSILLMSLEMSGFLKFVVLLDHWKRFEKLIKVRKTQVVGLNYFFVCILGSIFLRFVTISMSNCVHKMFSTVFVAPISRRRIRLMRNLHNFDSSFIIFFLANSFC